MSAELPAPTAASATASPGGGRIPALDQLRGLVMVLMVLDHMRDFMGWTEPPERMADPGAWLFLTRWVTHFCAPVFFLLAGVGAWFSGRGRSKATLARYLAGRGAWLIFLDLTVLFFGWFFLPPFAGLIVLQVIYALGVAMIVLAALVWLPRWALWALALPIVFGHDALSRLPLDRALVAAGQQPVTGAGEIVWSLAHVGFKGFPIAGNYVVIIYPWLPWVALLVAGYALGPSLAERGARQRTCLVLGISLSALFVLSRWLWPGLDLHAPNDGAGWIDFLNCSKYPPSMPFLAMTLGPAFLLVALFDACTDRHAPGPLGRMLLVFGRVPLFFYVVHVYLGHLVGTLWVWWVSGSWFTQVFATPPADVPGLGQVYLAWGLVVLATYPLCKAYRDLKARRRDLAWLRYL